MITTKKQSRKTALRKNTSFGLTLEDITALENYSQRLRDVETKSNPIWHVAKKCTTCRHHMAYFRQLDGRGREICKYWGEDIWAERFRESTQNVNWKNDHYCDNWEEPKSMTD